MYVCMQPHMDGSETSNYTNIHIHTNMCTYTVGKGQEEGQGTSTREASTHTYIHTNMYTYSRKRARRRPRNQQTNSTKWSKITPKSSLAVAGAQRGDAGSTSRFVICRMVKCGQLVKFVVCSRVAVAGAQRGGGRWIDD